MLEINILDDKPKLIHNKLKIEVKKSKKDVTSGKDLFYHSCQ